MMSVNIFVSPLDITDLVNTIKMKTNLKKLFQFEIYIILLLFKNVHTYTIYVIFI